MPSEKRVRRDDRREVTEGLPTEPVGPSGESSPVGIGQAQASPTELPPQKAILCDQISQRLSLLAIEPASDGEKQQPNDRHVDHERQLISRSKQHRSPTADPKLEHYGLQRRYGYIRLEHAWRF